MKFCRYGGTSNGQNGHILEILKKQKDYPFVLFRVVFPQYIEANPTHYDSGHKADKPYQEY